MRNKKATNRLIPLVATSVFSKKLDEERAELEKERKKMAAELSQYSYKTILKFQEVFPIEKICYTNQRPYQTYNYYDQNIIPKEGKDHIVNVSMLYKNSYEDFWYRWNRFKNLKAFL